MRSSVRGCIACILPCGALDVIRIVHSDGRVEEISGSAKVCAGEIMKLYPRHVLKKPAACDPSDHDHGLPRPKIVEVPPDVELRRGKIYFLMPMAPDNAGSRKTRSRTTEKKKRSKDRSAERDSSTEFLISDAYLSEITSEKHSSQRDRRRGRVGVWRPHLESISETLYDS